MMTFIKTFYFNSVSGIFNSEKDDKKINDYLVKVQGEGFKVSDIKVAISHCVVPAESITTVYLITLEGG